MRKVQENKVLLSFFRDFLEWFSSNSAIVCNFVESLAKISEKNAKRKIIINQEEIPSISKKDWFNALED